MGYEVIKLRHNSPEWLAFRKTGIGASEAAAVLGYSNTTSNVDLWEQKVGLQEPKNLDDLERVQYGIKAEKYLAGLFALQYADRYKMKIDKTVVYRKDGFQFASLDGELTDIKSKELGVYEGKTVVIDSRQAWEHWIDQIPQNYYIQNLHQMLVTGRKFVILNAEFRWTERDEGADEDAQVKTEGKRYLILQSPEVLADMRLLDEAEHEFWGYVKRKERPARLLPQI